MSALIVLSLLFSLEDSNFLVFNMMVAAMRFTFHAACHISLFGRTYAWFMQVA